MSEPAPGLGDELRRLVTDMSQWVTAAVDEVHELPTGPECGWCPVCQFADILRADHPEASERVKQAGAAFVAAFRAVMQAAAQPPAPHPRPSPHPRPEAASGPSASGEDA